MAGSVDKVVHRRSKVRDHPDDVVTVTQLVGAGEMAAGFEATGESQVP